MGRPLWPTAGVMTPFTLDSCVSIAGKPEFSAVLSLAGQG